MLNTQTFEKKGNLSSEKNNLIFFVFLNMTNVTKQFISLQKVFWPFLCKFYIFIGLKRSLETNISKKAILPVPKDFGPLFHINECQNLQETIYKGPWGNLTVTLDDIRSFLSDLRVCWKRKTLTKKAFFTKKKRLWPIFLRVMEFHKREGRNFKNCSKKAIFDVKKIGLFRFVLPSMADLRQVSIWLHNVFWQPLGKLKDLFCNT